MNIKETYRNKAYSECMANFTPFRDLRLNQTRKVKMGPPDPMTGYPVPMAEFNEDGDLTLRYYAPAAHEMKAVLGKYQQVREQIMEKRDDGVFEATFAYDPDFVGFRKVEFYLDGTQVLNDRLQIYPGGQTINNFIDIPDEAVPYIEVRDVPHGSICREIYYSHALGEWMRCTVYLPPDYFTGTGRYPVLYIQDGALGSDLAWMYETKLPFMMDNFIASGEVTPFIVVSNDPMMQLPYELEAVDNFDGFDMTITEDCIPFIDGRFRTIADKWHRGFAGFSLGSMETTYMGVNHPDLFGWLGILSGYMRRRDSHPSYEQNPYLYSLSRDFVNENYKLFFRCMGDCDGNFPEFLEDDEFCAERGASEADSYVRKVYPGSIHDVNVQRREFFDFSRLVFR